MNYPKVMTAGLNQSVVVASEAQERALPKDYGGLAAGPSYTEQSEVAAKPAPEVVVATTAAAPGKAAKTGKKGGKAVSKKK